MNEEKRKIVIGALSHDIGKVLYREAKITNHSDMGYDFLKEEIGISDSDILEQVKYHHSDKIRNANLKEDSFAYITYIADNIASMADRRESMKDNVEQPFDRSIPIDTIFNILNGNNENKHYRKIELKNECAINMPIDEKEVYDETFYNNIKNELIKSFQSILDEKKNINEEYINSYLACLETWLSYIPSSTNNYEKPDISLYDHLKITAAIALNIYDYLEANNIKNYKCELLDKKDAFYEKEAFLILSFDFSGIQEYIYMHGNDDAGMLKSLRVRSFYLEILLENILDELLEKLEISRTNILYSGGGHGYLLLANTNKNIEIIEEYVKNINKWILDKFSNKLYLSYGYSKCSARDLDSDHPDNYKNIFANIQKDISKNKLHRYSDEDIKYLNNNTKYVEGRECAICKKTDALVEDKNKNGNIRYICKMCKSIIEMSNEILNDKKMFFLVLNENDRNDITALPMPFNKKIILVNEENAREIIKNEKIRIYSKNEAWTGKGISTKLWIADYYKKDMPSFKELSNASYGGYKKLAVFRADVDNLGTTFVKGLPEKYRTISRTATFSRNMSLFFKKYIKNILENPESYEIVDIDEREKLNNELKTDNKRNIAIIYSGGDDIFAVGVWDDIINFAIDLYNNFSKFTQKKLTFSCGIGIFDDSFPVYNMAKFTGELEDISKSRVGKIINNREDDIKNAITLFYVPSVNDNKNIDDVIYKNTYRFDEFIDKVLKEKYCAIKEYFKNSSDKGRSFLYKLKELVENMDDKINLARLAYTLARAKPKDKNEQKQDETINNYYKSFTEKVFNWVNNKEDAKQLLTAIELYGYYSREREGK